MSGSRDHRTGAKRFRTSYNQPRSEIKLRVDPGIALRYAVEQTRSTLAKTEQALVEAENRTSPTGRPLFVKARTRNQLREEIGVARAAHRDAVEELRRWEYDNLQGEYAVDTAVDGDAVPVPPVSPEQPGGVVREPTTARASVASTAADEVVPTGSGVEYRRLVELVEGRESDRYGVRAQRTGSGAVRDADARRAVLLRAAGRCENPACGGQPDDVTAEGAAILEVDHICEIAQGGRDYPVQMVALCPNCHAMKGRGRNREALREVLLDVALKAHTVLSPTPVSPHPGGAEYGVDSVR